MITRDKELENLARGRMTEIAIASARVILDQFNSSGVEVCENFDLCESILEAMENNEFNSSHCIDDVLNFTTVLVQCRRAETYTEACNVACMILQIARVHKHRSSRENFEMFFFELFLAQCVQDMSPFGTSRETSEAKAHEIVRGFIP